MSQPALTSDNELTLNLSGSAISSWQAKIAGYYELTKPERTLANVMTASAGFLLAANWRVNFTLLLATIFGTTALVASACVLNNCIDHKIDAQMERTKKRVLAQGIVPLSSALIYAIILGICGIVLLAALVNWLVLILGLIAYLDYVVLYGYSKRHSVHGTLIGTVSGAMPIAAGYIAVTERISPAAVMLFLIMTFWQMGHFYAIAIYRLKDYRKANIPVLPAVKGIMTTQVQIVAYVVLFMCASISLSIFGYSGYIYGIAAGLIGLIWLGRSLRGFKAKDNTAWARKVFLASLNILLALMFFIAVGRLLP